MITGIFHTGSGLGNQLHRYVMTRVVAVDRGFDFGMVEPEKFKGKNFMKLDMGKPYTSHNHIFVEKRVDSPHGIDIRGYDWSIKDIADNTLIDGEFQGEEYYKHRLGDINEWLTTEPLDMPDDLCVINFRGTHEYAENPALYLTKEYWNTAMRLMNQKHRGLRYEVHTDDAGEAQRFFPGLPVVTGMEINWRSIRYAKHLILSNSSFAILPALLSPAKTIMAPKFWARRNLGIWSMAQNIYERFEHI